jgi:predicted ATP-dependent protease
VQAIGGVNEKIEGFFDICSARGLTGEQGVIVPRANTAHLMLRSDVVEAARAGRFHIHAVGHVDEAMRLLTGLETGEPAPDGSYPEGSFNARVSTRVRELVEARKEFLGKGEGRHDPPGD